MRLLKFVLPAVMALPACDSRAKASDPPKPERVSKELESCSSAEDCEGDLRCIDLTCRRPQRSSVGDYFAGLGAVRRSRNDLEGAVAAYNDALGHYDSEKVKLPAEIDCAYGGALAAARDVKKEYAERAAKVLHRCVLAVPGGRLRDQAMLDLALLEESGLDPLALGRAQLSDVYLTKGPSKPSADKLTMSMSAAPALPAAVQTALQTNLDGQKAALAQCWQTFVGTSKKDALVVTIGARTSFYKNPDYDDDPGSVSTRLDPPAQGLAGPDAGAESCVRPILEAALKAAPKETFNAKITITLK